MKGYPFNTVQTVGIIWAVLIGLFVLIVVVIPWIVDGVREARARNRYLAHNPRRSQIEQEKNMGSWR